jgi:hypothetical protein
MSFSSGFEVRFPAVPRLLLDVSRYARTAPSFKGVSYVNMSSTSFAIRSSLDFGYSRIFLFPRSSSRLAKYRMVLCHFDLN